MAPERTNTHRVSLDYIAQLKNLLPNTRHAYAVLKVERLGVPYRRFSAALQYNFVSQREAQAVEAAWEAWKHHFLADVKTHYFDLPDEKVPRA